MEILPLTVPVDTIGFDRCGNYVVAKSPYPRYRTAPMW